jgi:hypothetical protein
MTKIFEGRINAARASKVKLARKEKAQMKLQRILIAVTVLNIGLTVFLLSQLHRTYATTNTPSGSGSPAGVLRGSSLEIVDDQGRVRASIKLHEADTKYKWPDGRIGYPETVMLRLIDQNGRPEVKMGASEKGGGLGLVGENDATQAILEAQGFDTKLKLANKEGKQQLIKP